LCSLTEKHYSVARRRWIEYDDPLIAEFARYFGQPELDITVDPDSRVIVAATVRRDAVCGCARFVAERLVGLSADEAGEQAGLLHHHFPCLASMTQDPDYSDTLMHVSGHLVRDAVHAEIRAHLSPVAYLRPSGRTESAEETG
jgi:hypothetical protein